MTPPSILLVCLIGLTTFSPVAGQDSVWSTPRAIVKFAPLSLVDIDATVQGAIEFPVGARTTGQIEGGYGWAGLSRSVPRDGGLSNKQTGRIRAEGRYYLSKTASFADTPYLTGVYVAGEILGKRISAERLQRVVSPCLAAPCPANTETAIIHRTILGGHLKVGYQTGFAAFDPRGITSRFVLDLYVGFGARHIRVRQSAGPPIMPANGNTPEGLRFTRFVPGRDFWTRSLAGGIKVGFAL